MHLTRRDMLKATAAIAGALGVSGAGLWKEQEALAKTGGLPVVWFQAQCCTGCSVSLLNSIYYATIDDLLLNTLDLKYHPNLSAAAGQTAISAAEAAYQAGKYVLVVEGAVPTADNGRACYLWPGMTAMAGVRRYAARAGLILTVGTCSSYGGMSGGKPNPTAAKSVKALLGTTSVPIVSLPGCPVHPDWVVGTVAYILKNGKAPTLDANGRPTDFYGKTVHSQCPNLPSYVGANHHSNGRACTQCHTVSTRGGGGGGGEDDEAGPLSPNLIPAATLSQANCLSRLGCKGPVTGCDCPTRKWNSAAPATPGVNWCIGARSPCFGCTEPSFPDGMSPFYTAMASTAAAGGTTGGGGTAPVAPAHSNGQPCTNCHAANDPRIQYYTHPTGTTTTATSTTTPSRTVVDD
jgi:hydrogenase small subunit